MGIYLRLFLGGLLLSLLAACASMPDGKTDSTRAQSAAQLAKVPSPSAEQPFHRQGRFAVHAERMNDQPEAVQGGFNWYDNGQQLVVELRYPWGHGQSQRQREWYGA